MNLAAISAITRKDVVDAIRHRYLLTAMATPLFVALMFRVMLPGMNSRSILTIVVHDAGHSQMVSDLRQAAQIEPASGSGVVADVERRNAIGGLVLPANFDADIAAGKQPELTVYVNNRKNVFEQSGFRRLVNETVREFAKQPQPARLTWVDIDESAKRETVRGTDLNRLLLPLLLLLTLGMIGAFVVPLLIVEEKEKRTLDFLLSSPAGLNDILAGKGLTGVVYTLLIAALLLGINRQFVENWFFTLMTIALGLGFVVAVGLVIGSLLKNTMQVNTWASLVLIVLLVPAFPSLGLSGWFDTAMRAVPTHYLSDALRLSMAGTIGRELWIDWAVLAGCTVITFLAAAWALHRRA
jgi:ABC-2 type transport system permease protein